jgi:hypothetical protein
MKNVNLIEIFWNPKPSPCVSDLMIKKYGKHCIFAECIDDPDIYSCFRIAKIVQLNLDYRCLNELEYLMVFVSPHDFAHVSEGHWDRYKEFFIQCSKLKGVSFYEPADNRNLFESREFRRLDYSSKTLWRDMYLYVQSLGIEILDCSFLDDYYKLAEIKAKELNVPWRFDMYFGAQL